MKKGIILAVVLAGLLGSFFYLRGNGLVFRLSESQLKAAMEESLPMTKTYFLVFDVTLSNPSVDLKSGSSRIYSGLDVLLELSFLGLKEKAQGHVNFSGEISYKKKTKEFFLVKPLIEDVTIEGLSDEKANQANEAVSAALAAYFEDLPIYTLKPADVKTFTTSLFLKSVMVKNEKLVVTMGL